MVDQVDNVLSSLGKETYYSERIPHFSFASTQHQITDQGKVVLKGIEEDYHRKRPAIKALGLRNDELISAIKSTQCNWYHCGSGSDSNHSDNANGEYENDVLGQFRIEAKMATIKIKIGPDFYYFPLF